MKEGKDGRGLCTGSGRVVQTPYNIAAATPFLGGPTAKMKHQPFPRQLSQPSGVSNPGSRSDPVIAQTCRSRAAAVLSSCIWS